MDKNRDKWVSESLRSLEDMRRAQPPAELFNRIEQDLFGTKAKVISIERLRLAAAAAIILLVGNVYALRQYAQTSNLEGTEMVAEEQNVILSSYKLYD